ncbi:MAG: Lrp/AsnC family transcriptional regulator [Chloroflexi bacterium]|nr:Lrp/AsnC family transcriptional regulator [Chloroflexota bacterium]
MATPDKTDERLVRLLGQDAKQNSEDLAKQLKLSAATVRRRLRKLLRLGLLRIVGVIDPARFGFPLAAVITIDVAHDALNSVMKTLSEHPEIVWLSTTTGRFDIVTMARFRSSDALSEFLTKKLAQIEGVRDSETFICLDVQKGAYVRIPI